MDLDHALESHVAWKVGFRMAILQQGTVDAACVGREDCCELGLWLLGEGRTLCGAMEAFGTCLAAHQDFHREAGRVARAINAGRLEEASRLMKPSETFTRSSAALGNAISQLLQSAHAARADAAPPTPAPPGEPRA